MLMFVKIKSKLTEMETPLEIIVQIYNMMIKMAFIIILNWTTLRDKVLNTKGILSKMILIHRMNLLF